ncbi:DinB family protein [Planococcus sp. CAU13]|uniref:DinB family protein n=1 Tax=Planococcus sp. CAU13 TaxID=1541197 RepID=UPI00068CA105|nr:DinB family protein [Planococcus sp. CAU13]
MDAKFFLNGLHGERAHVDTETVFDGMGWQQAGEKKGDFPHSVWELLFHMNYWQYFMLDILEGDMPDGANADAASWPPTAGPESEEEWEAAVVYFRNGLKAAEAEAEKDLNEQVAEGSEATRAECLQTIVLHNSYHAGQVAFARKIMGAWPPSAAGNDE